MPSVRLFLDVDDLQDIALLEQYIGESGLTIIFISRGYWISRNCMREARATVDEHKPSVLVHEADTAKGGISWHDQLKECPSEMRFLVAQPLHPVVPWLRISRFQLESLKQISRALLLATPKYCKLCGEQAALD